MSLVNFKSKTFVIKDNSKKVIKNMKKADKAYVDVGWFTRNAMGKTNIPTYALANNVGVPGTNREARHYVELAIESGRREMQVKLGKAKSKISDGVSPKKALIEPGVVARGHLQRKITELNVIDTGAMRASVDIRTSDG